MFSIITPTYNRADILNRSLEFFFRMEGVEKCQVIVIDDGSSDHTDAILKHFEEKYPGLFKGIKQKNSGPGEARNAGLELAEKDLILFLDDDVMPDDQLLKKHLAFIDKGFDVSQGIMFWAPEIESDPVIEFMDRHGYQFSFDKVKSEENLSYLYVYTANLAVKKEHIHKYGGFDKKLAPRQYAFEDTGMAYNLWKAGLKLGLNRQAWALHYHPMTEEQLVNRTEKCGYAYGVLEDAYPEIVQAMNIRDKMRFLMMQRTILFPLVKLQFFEMVFGWDFFLRLRCRDAFLRGLLEYRNEKSRN